MGSSARTRGYLYSLGCHHLGVPKRTRHLTRQGPRVAPLLPRDMEGLRRTRKQDMFMSLKRDLVMVSQLAPF